MPYINDGALYYRMTGAGKPVVFVHGAAGTGQLFANQFQAFRDIARCYFPDLPSHGQSAAASALSIFVYAEAVAGLARSIGEPVILAGHSMGGAVILELARTHPDLVRNLIFIGTSCRLPVSAKILAGLESDYDATLTAIARYCFSKTVEPDLLAMARDDMKKAAPDVVRADFQMCDRFNGCESAGAIRASSLVIAGEKDVMMPLAASEDLKHRIPNSKLAVVANGSHMLMLEQSTDFNAVLRDFLVLI